MAGSFFQEPFRTVLNANQGLIASGFESGRSAGFFSCGNARNRFPAQAAAGPAVAVVFMADRFCSEP
jgi:hypothetical protein